MRTLSLVADWRLLEAPLHWDANCLARVMGAQDGWMECALPCDVHMPLQQAGRIRDVVLADYSFEAEWIERRSWWFVHTFDGGEVDVGADVVELVFESLDAHADIFLNGEHLGTHESAHYPFVAGVKGRIRQGGNVLALRLTTGMEQVSERDLSELNWAVCHEEGNGCPERGDRRRACVRKPTYTVGWDWGPKALSCGIVKPAYIRTYRKTAVRSAHVWTESIEGGTAHLRLSVEIDQLHTYATRDARIHAAISYAGQVAASASVEDELLTSGLNYIDMDIDVPDARLWWPNGCGDQPLYSVDIRVECDGETECYPAFNVGIRTVKLCTERQSERERAFTVLVNGVPVFCKGGDWIPADSIYARVTADKYETLVREAAHANFNMLRIWGGGIYETDAFYDACDRHGLLIWHDFMFSCSAYPDHIEDFRRLVEHEMDYQTKRLRNRASLALWCGNNENHWIFNPEDNPQWGIDLSYEKQYGLLTGNEMAKRAVRNNCREIPYWNSSPYGGARPNADEVGDTHHWHACMMNPEMKKRIDPEEYDKVGARFVSEYGYPGPPCQGSIVQYFDGQPVDRTGKVWDLHNNTFEKRTVNAGIEKHYGVDASRLTLEEYLEYAGMVQSLMLEYSLEALRFKLHCGGGLFWMYNDTWGEIGWTIIDYFLRRKISFYGVRRAFAPVKLTLRKTADGKARLVGANDTASPVTLQAEVGFVRFDGQKGALEPLTLTLPARSRVDLGEFLLPDADDRAGVFAVVPTSGDVAPAVLRRRDTAQLQIGGGNIEVLESRREGGDLLVSLTADRYCHGVHFVGSELATDNYFDLLPGQRKTVRLYGADKPPVWKSVR